MSLTRGSAAISLSSARSDLGGGLSRSRRDLYAMAARHALLGLTPVLFTVVTVVLTVHSGVFAFDFRYAYWNAAHSVVHGLSPYVSPYSAAATSNKAFIYPALPAVALVPLTALPKAVATGLFTALVLGAMVGAIWLLGVRDWRVYGVTLLWPPVVTAWQNANVTGLLVLGTALVWKWRDRPAAAGLMAALMVSIKPLVWPLGLWFLATRRYAAAAYALIGGVVINAAVFAVIGPGELSRYLHLLSSVTRVEERDGYGVIALAIHFGASRSAAYGLGIGVAAVAAIACIAAARRGEELRSMILCVTVMLLASPILWTHYFALLLVPLALTAPRFTVAWLLPIAMLVAPETPPHLWQRLLVLAVASAVVASMLGKVPASLPFSRVGAARRLAGA